MNFKNLINKANAAIQNFDFDPKAAAKTVMDTVKSTPQTVRDSRDAVKDHYKRVKFVNKHHAEKRVAAEAFDLKTEVKYAIAKMSNEEMIALVESHGLKVVTELSFICAMDGCTTEFVRKNGMTVCPSCLNQASAAGWSMCGTCNVLYMDKPTCDCPTVDK